MLHNEVKGQLAKLLATENLTIEHRKCQTASFNVETRVLTLPLWDVSDHVHTMLVGHEVGHALFTPNDDSLENLPCPKSYVNVTEDARIEKHMKRKFPGLTKDFFRGYAELHASDFFQVADTKLETLKLIDRINLYFKVGANLLLPFDDSETPLRDAVSAAETFQEAIDAAYAIYEFEKRKQQEKLDTANAPKGGQDRPQDKVSGDGEGERPEQQEGESDNVSDESTQNETSAENAGRGAGEECNLESDTDTALQERLKDITSQSSWNEVKYLDIDDADIDHIVVPVERIKQMCESYWDQAAFNDPELENYTPVDFSFVDGEYLKFKRECSREVNYLSKEFEMKKSAAAYARESISRTGVLDTKKLHTYKYNEDLFKKITVRPDGKNHGLIFILDWSGSMAEVLHDTYKQLLSLCLFCRKSGIPFEVYSFVNDGSFLPQDFDCEAYTKRTAKVGYFSPHEMFFMPNLLSSRLNNSNFDKMATYLWRVTYHYWAYYGGGRGDYDLRCKCPGELPHILGLSGTPLNEAIVTLQSLIPAFQRKNGVEKVHVTILTDGEAQQSGEWIISKYKDSNQFYRSAIHNKVVVRDRKKGYTYAPKNGGLTAQLLRYMKGRFPQCNFLGFRIASTRDFNFLVQFSGLTPAECENAKKEWNRTKSSCIVANGFQELYFLSANHLNIDTEFEVESDATNAQIRNAFKKSLKSKANNKKILSSFVTQIA